VIFIIRRGERREKREREREGTHTVDIIIRRGERERERALSER